MRLRNLMTHAWDDVHPVDGTRRASMSRRATLGILGEARADLLVRRAVIIVADDHADRGGVIRAAWWEQALTRRAGPAHWQHAEAAASQARIRAQRSALAKAGHDHPIVAQPEGVGVLICFQVDMIASVGDALLNHGFVRVLICSKLGA